MNLQAAKDFVNYLTSPALQGQLSSYLDDTSDSPPPFIADASPTISLTTGFPSTVNAGQSVTVSGSVITNEIGYPEPSGATVTVDQISVVSRFRFRAPPQLPT